jgi:hypothetical protein
MVFAGSRNADPRQVFSCSDGTKMESIQTHTRRPDSISLRASRFDQVASLLLALLLIVGVMVVGLFIVWLTATIVFHKEGRVRVWDVVGTTPFPDPRDVPFEPPSQEEVPELIEPQVEPSVVELADAASQVAKIDHKRSDSDKTGPGQDGPGGPNRPMGPPSDGPIAIPRWERWEIRFESSSIEAYARQLDFFKIELGSAGGGRSQIDYAYNLVKTRPDSRIGPGNKEQRLYMTWRGGTLLQFDKQLLARAGINTTNRVVLQFYPEEVEKQLAQIEKDNADQRGKTLPEYLKTVFRVERSGSDWRFIVVEQRFRPAPSQGGTSARH